MLYPIEQDPLIDFLPEWIIENTKVIIQVPQSVAIE